MKTCDMFPTHTKLVHGSGFVRWLNSQFFWQLKSSGSDQQLSLQLGRSPFLFYYGLAAVILGILAFCMFLGIQPMILSGLQQDISSKAYGSLLTTFVNNNLLFFFPFILTFAGIWQLGFRGSLIVDGENLQIFKCYSLFNLSLWSRTWKVKQLKELSCGRRGKGLVSSKIFQLRLVWDDQPSRAILTCGGGFREPLSSIAEKIAAELNVPLTSR